LIPKSLVNEEEGIQLEAKGSESLVNGVIPLLTEDTKLQASDNEQKEEIGLG